MLSLKINLFLQRDMKKNFEYNPDTLEQVTTDTITEEATGWSLIVWNDDVNTFDWVIETLVKVCKHEATQAEQCAIIIHFKGKCAVKNGGYDELKAMCDAITEREIGATVEGNQ